MKKQNLFVVVLLLIIGGLVYLLVSDTEVPSTADIGEIAEDILEKDVEADDEEEVAVTEEEDESDEEETVDDETDESDDEEMIDEEPIDEFVPVEVTDDYLGTTFENNTYGYTVDFPENWYWERLEAAFLGPREDYLWLDPTSGFVEGEYPGMAHVAVLDSTLAQELQQRDDWGQAYTLSEVTVGGVTATRVAYDVSGGLWSADESIHVYIEQNGLLYEIGMYPDGHDEELFQRILNSFAFID